MKKTILALALVAALGACKKSTEPNPQKEQKLPTDIQVGISYGNLQKEQNQQGNATYNFIGFGYDVTDQYNSANSVRAEVVNMSSFTANQAKRINTMRGTEMYWEDFSGEDGADLARQLANQVEETKGLKVFKNTVSQAFPQSNPFDGKYVYAYYANVFKRMSMAIIRDYDDILTNYLSNGFSQDLNTLSAADLVKKYGTHMLRGVALGSRLKVVYRAEAPQGNRKKTSMMGLRYAMKNIFGLSTSDADAVDLVALNANSAAKVYVDATGGDVSKIVAITVNKKELINMTNWRNSVTDENIKFIGSHGLIPLDELITDAGKKAAVKAYITKYIQEQEAKI